MNKIVRSSKDLEKKKDTPLTDASDLQQKTPSASSPADPSESSRKEAPVQDEPGGDSASAPRAPLPEEDLALYRAVCGVVRGFMQDASGLDMDAVTAHARRIVARLQESDGLLRLVMRPFYVEPFIGAHPTNVAILAALVADVLDYTEDQRNRLVTAALVHDIGMSRLPAEVMENTSALTPEEEEDLREHPNFGANMILDTLGDGYDRLAQVVRQEHERVQGQGYPYGLKEDRIDPFALIIGLLDVYEAITHPRYQHAAYNPSKAISQVVAARQQLFSTRMVKALLEAVSMYPIESYVQLNTGQIGCVAATSRKNPLRPTVDILTNHDGQPLPRPQRLDLQEHPVISIMKALDDSEIPAALKQS